MKNFILTLLTLCCFFSTLPAVEFATSLSAFFDNLEKNKSFAGAVIIAKEDSILFEKYMGEASREFQIAIDKSTRFNLGEISAFCTALAALPFIEEKKLQVTDSLEKYLHPELLPHLSLPTLNLLHLLTQTSGISSIFETEIADGLSLWDKRNKALYTSLPDYLALLKDVTSLSSPGAKVQYSPSNSLLLGKVLEKITGENFYDLIEKTILKKTSIEDAGFLLLSKPLANIATGYTYFKSGKNGEWKNNYFTRPEKGSPGDSFYISARQMHTLLSAFMSYKLCGKTMVKQCFIPYKKLTMFEPSNNGTGPAQTFQGLISTLHLLDFEGKLRPITDNSLHLKGLPDLAANCIVASLASHKEDGSCCVDIITNREAEHPYFIIVLSNQGAYHPLLSYPPAETVASKLRRLILNGIRANHHTGK